MNKALEISTTLFTTHRLKLQKEDRSYTKRQGLVSSFSELNLGRRIHRQVGRCFDGETGGFFSFSQIINIHTVVIEYRAAEMLGQEVQPWHHESAVHG